MKQPLISLKDELDDWRKKRRSIRLLVLACLGLTTLLILASVRLYFMMKKPPVAKSAEIISAPVEKAQTSTTPAAPIQPATSSAFVNVVDGVNLRAEASASSKTLVVVPFRGEIKVDKVGEVWSLGSYSGQQGYFTKSYTVGSKEALTP